MHGTHEPRTIEPRLIALLNTPPTDFTSTAHYSPFSLPPLHDPNILKSSGRPSPLEPNAGSRNVKSSASSNQQAGNHGSATATAKTLDRDLETPKKPQNRAANTSSPQSLRKILDDPDTSSSFSSSTSKKHSRGETSKEEFVQLPQPPKKVKAVKQSVPPIIIGLFEPPPQTAVFPPIASSSFHDSHGRNSLNIAPAPVTNSANKKTAARIQSEASEVVEEADDGAAKAKGRALERGNEKTVKSRNKWTEDESNDLLRGVQKHGIGKWKVILEDAEFSFNGRNAVDIKDRFRVICPDELRGKSTSKKLNEAPENETFASKSKFKAKSNPIFDNILVSSSSESETEEPIAPMTSSADGKPRKSKAHRKKLSDLAQLGISTPFAPSSRRSRRPFTDDEDRSILRGFELHGQQWALIVKDETLGLAARKPTDIRDRLRNRWPEKYSSGGAEKDKNKATQISGSQQSRVKKTKAEENSIQHPGPTPNSSQENLSSKQQRTAYTSTTYNNSTSFTLPNPSNPPHPFLSAISYDPLPSHYSGANIHSSHPFTTSMMPTLTTTAISGSGGGSNSFSSSVNIPAMTAPTFMSFSEMLNGDGDIPDWDFRGQDVVGGEMDISRLLTDMTDGF